jgi:hypothetical protein
MSWLFSRALVEEFSAATFSGGEPCAQLSVMPTAQPFWRNDKPMDASRFSRFGLTSQLLTAGRGEELLTWFRAGFPARTLVSPEAETDWTEPEAACGFKWPGSFARYDRSGSTWRTRQCSLLEDSEEYSETWPSSGSMRNGECLARPPLAPHISGTESGLLPTPVCVDTGSYFNKSASVGAARRPTLGAMAKHNLWPTPTVCGNYNRKGLTATSGDGLATAVRNFPTPTVAMRKGSSGGALTRKSGRSRENDRLYYAIEGDATNGRLNPDWVEWLMGWPIGWTALQPLEMDKFLEWQQQHGNF